MKTQSRRASARTGFTLIELVVVLMILIGLAAIMIPAVTNMVARTSASSVSSNLKEVANAIQRYEAQYLAYPNNLDGLVTDNAGTALDTLDTVLSAGLANVTLNAARRAPLTACGITSIGYHTAGDNTFDKSTATALADDDIVLGLTAAKQVALGLETTGAANKYIVFGVGTLSDMNGKTMIDAPVYFPSDNSNNPSTIYGRYIAIFQITDGTNPLDRARFVGIMTPTGDSLNTAMELFFNQTWNN